MRLLETKVAQRARRNPFIRPPAMAAYRALDRMLPAPPGPRVLANSMPKAGTHLLMSLLESLPQMRFAGQVVSYLGEDAVGEEQEFAHLARRLERLRDSHYVIAHLTRDPAVEDLLVTSGAQMVTMVRDPRSAVVSWAHYLLTTRHVPGREWVRDRYPDFDTLVPALVRGFGEPHVFPYLPEVGERFRRYTAWSESEFGIVARFEDLVGTKGGGHAERQHEVTRGIIEYLGYSDPQALSDEIVPRIFSANSATFRSGHIDSWRQELPAELADEIHERCGTHMEKWGYGS